MIQYPAGVLRELRDQYIAAPDGKPPWSTKAFGRPVRAIEHHDVGGSAIFVDEFSDMNPREWTKRTSTTWENATETYMVEVIAESNK